MKHLQLNLFFPVILFLVAASCGTPSGNESEGSVITISGVVVSNATNNLLNDAIVELSVGSKTSVQVTNAQGAYQFEVRVDSLVTVTLRALKEGFVESSQQAFGVPGRNIVMPDFRLAVEGSNDPGTDPGTGPGDGTQTGNAHSIQLSGVSNSTVQVVSTGGIEQSQLTFVVRDSIGRAISESRAVDVVFSFGARPNGGEVLSETTVRTDRSGLARTMLRSGTVSGVVQVLATVTLPGGAILRSQPVNLMINSGLPDAAHFSLATEFLNIPGCARYGDPNVITAFMGDRYGNFVPANTAVYFTTDGGIINGSSVSGPTGTATTTMLGAAPCPTHPSLGAGFATVRGRTADINNNTIESSIIVLFSSTTTLDISPQIVNVPHGGSQSFVLTVQDTNGNPLAPGSSITVEAEGDGVVLLGDASVILGDTQSSGPGTTVFRFTLQDADLEVNEQKAVEVKIDVVSPNGNISARLSGSSFKILPQD